MVTQIPMYRFYLQGERISKIGMYLYLKDTNQALQKPNSDELISNHAKILANVVFQQRGNDFLQD